MPDEVCGARKAIFEYRPHRAHADKSLEVPFKTEYVIVMQQQDQPYTKSLPCPSFFSALPIRDKDQRKQDDVVYLPDSINRKRKSADSNMRGGPGANKVQSGPCLGAMMIETDIALG